MSAQTHPAPPGDEVLARLRKARAYVEALYRLHPQNVRMLPDHKFSDLAFVESQDFWRHVRAAVAGYQQKPPPSQETVSMICELIVMVEECKAQGST